MTISMLSIAGVVLLCLLNTVTAVNNKKVVCYYTNWSSYRLGAGKFVPEDVDPHLCTHIMYSFTVMEPSDNTIKLYDTWLDINSNFFQKITDLKRSNPNLKVLVAVGGWTEGSINFSNMAKTRRGRTSFIKSVIDLLSQHNFDGLDLDWEYPAKRGGIPEDKKNFDLLIEELQDAFTQRARKTGTEKYLLTAAVAATENTAAIAYNKANICRMLDFVNLMEYDFHGTWEGQTGYLARLNGGPYNVHDTVQRWIGEGCAPEKLIMGMPLYGRVWKLSNPRQTSVGSPGGVAPAGQFTGEGGMLAYYEICEKLNQGWVEKYDQSAGAPYAYGDGQWVSYDNRQSIKQKSDYIAQYNLGGAMVWALDFDDFKGAFCNQGKYPLLSYINQEVRDLNSGDRVVVSPRKFGTTQKPQRNRTPQNSRTTNRLRPKTRKTTRQPKRTPTTRAPQRKNRRCGEPICIYEKNHGSYHKDTCDSTKFWQCWINKAWNMSCPRDLIYDPIAVACEYPKARVNKNAFRRQRPWNSWN